MDPWLVAGVLGLLQGLLEWLPVSSEGAITIARSALGAAPDVATRYALFLHAGTAVAAAAYYRTELVHLAAAIPTWRPRSAFGPGTADLSFFGLATLCSGVVGVTGYAVLADLAQATAGGVFVAGIGALLLATGVFMRVAEHRATGRRDRPELLDAVLIGVLQGFAVLPGISRSGTTVSALLLRGHDGPDALRLSFLLSIPAAAGAGLLVVVDHGLPTGGLGPAVLALGISAVVGYLAVDALVRLVSRVAFWRVCVGFGALAVIGGLLVLL
ncbi:MAG: undecaprenyl-diphosphate phosphatase [Salinirussus sp.]